MKNPKELIQREADCIDSGSYKKPNTVRIGDVPGKTEVCRDSEHNPPTHAHYKPGTYQHTCPSCFKQTIFVVPETTM